MMKPSRFVPMVPFRKGKTSPEFGPFDKPKGFMIHVGKSAIAVPSNNLLQVLSQNSSAAMAIHGTILDTTAVLMDGSPQIQNDTIAAILTGTQHDLNHPAESAILSDFCFSNGITKIAETLHQWWSTDFNQWILFSTKIGIHTMFPPMFTQFSPT